MMYRRAVATAAVIAAVVGGSVAAAPSAYAGSVSITAPAQIVGQVGAALSTSPLDLSGFTNCSPSVTFAGSSPVPGLTFGADGSVSGTPTQSGDFGAGPFTISCDWIVDNTDPQNPVMETDSGSVSYSFSIAPAPSISSATSSVSGRVSAPISSTAPFTPANFSGSVAYGASSVPPGLTFDTTTGVFSGTPSATFGPTDVTVTGTSGSQTATATLTFTIDVAPALSPATQSIAGTAGSAIAATSTLTANFGAATFAVSGSPALPSGLVLDPATGKVTGTPSSSGTTTVTITGTGPYTASATITFTIAAAASGGGSSGGSSGSSGSTGGSTGGSTTTGTGTSPTNPVVAPGVTMATPIVANGPANPPNGKTSVTVAPGVTFLSKSAALSATPRYYKAPATRTIATAPRAVKVVNGQLVPIYRVHQLVRLVARVPAKTVYDLRIKVGGKYYDAGAALSDADGFISLPVFGATRAVTYPFAFVDSLSGKTWYVKVNIGRAIKVLP